MRNHSYSLDVTVRTDTVSPRTTNKRSAKAEKLQLIQSLRPPYALGVPGL